MSAQPTRAFLHQVVTTATSADGTSYSVAYVEDPDGERHLVFACSARFGELAILPLMRHSEIRLTGGSPSPEVLPLHLQDEDLQLQVTEKIRTMALLGQAFPAPHPRT